MRQPPIIISVGKRSAPGNVLRQVYRVNSQRATMAQEASTFRTDWAFPSEVKTALGADSYEVIDTQLAYSTGRTKYEARFYSGKGRERQLITTRDAMELIGKGSGKKYFVCRAAERPVL